MYYLFHDRLDGGMYARHITKSCLIGIAQKPEGIKVYCSYSDHVCDIQYSSIYEDKVLRHTCLMS